MAASGFVWIKLYTDMLDDIKIARLSDALKWRFVQLCLLAGECDSEGYFISGDQPMTAVDIAWRLRLDPDALERDLNTLKASGLIDFSGVMGWCVTKFSERQGQSQEMRREQWRERKARQRERVSQSGESDPGAIEPQPETTAPAPELSANNPPAVGSMTTTASENVTPLSPGEVTPTSPVLHAGVTRDIVVTSRRDVTHEIRKDKKRKENTFAAGAARASPEVPPGEGSNDQDRVADDLPITGVDEKTRPKNWREMRHELLKRYLMLTGQPAPSLRTKAQARQTQLLWFAPLEEILSWTNWQVGAAAHVVERTYRKLKTNGLTVANPNSLLNTARDEYATLNGGGKSGTGRSPLEDLGYTYGGT